MLCYDVFSRQDLRSKKDKEARKGIKKKEEDQQEEEQEMEFRSESWGWLFVVALAA
tara:strand:+ start:967 stop:1134 length:168 start_codon:yes stop_codon:yes gene_type:complete